MLQPRTPRKISIEEQRRLLAGELPDDFLLYNDEVNAPISDTLPTAPPDYSGLFPLQQPTTYLDRREFARGNAELGSNIGTSNPTGSVFGPITAEEANANANSWSLMKEGAITPEQAIQLEAEKAMNSGQPAITVDTNSPQPVPETTTSATNPLRNDIFPALNLAGSNLDTELYALGRGIGASKGTNGRGATIVGAGGAAALDIAGSIASGIGFERRNQMMRDFADEKMKEINYTPAPQYQNENTTGGAVFEKGGTFNGEDDIDKYPDGGRVSYSRATREQKAGMMGQVVATNAAQKVALQPPPPEETKYYKYDQDPSRKGVVYTKVGGQWMMVKSRNGEYFVPNPDNNEAPIFDPLNDPTGERAKLLDKFAVPMEKANVYSAVFGGSPYFEKGGTKYADAFYEEEPVKKYPDGGVKVTANPPNPYYQEQLALYNSYNDPSKFTYKAEKVIEGPELDAWYNQQISNNPSQLEKNGQFIGGFKPKKVYLSENGNAYYQVYDKPSPYAPPSNASAPAGSTSSGPPAQPAQSRVGRYLDPHTSQPLSLEVYGSPGERDQQLSQGLELTSMTLENRKKIEDQKLRIEKSKQLAATMTKEQLDEMRSLRMDPATYLQSKGITPTFEKGGTFKGKKPTDPPARKVKYKISPDVKLSYYDPQTDEVILSSEDSKNAEVIAHELAHTWQRDNGLLRSDPNTPKAEPVIPSSQEMVYDYYNRDTNDQMNNINNLPQNFQDITGNIWTDDMNLISPDLKTQINKELLYYMPNTAEGQAEFLSKNYGNPPGYELSNEDSFKNGGKKSNNFNGKYPGDQISFKYGGTKVTGVIDRIENGKIFLK